MTRDPARDGDPLVDGVETAVSPVPDDAPETTYASRTWSIRPGVGGAPGHGLALRAEQAEKYRTG
ncbi:hypothetical protein N7U49_42290 [Streptomyces sp. AD2-2]|nr:hypothetical protein N7U49_42290 [Streptomyces sp. AD2-2]